MWTESSPELVFLLHPQPGEKLAAASSINNLIQEKEIKYCLLFYFFFPEFTYWISAPTFLCPLLAWGMFPCITLRARFFKTEKKLFLYEGQQGFGVYFHGSKAQAGCSGLLTSWQKQPALGYIGYTPQSHLERKQWSVSDLPVKAEYGDIHCHPVKAKVSHTLRTPGLFASVSSQYIHAVPSLPALFVFCTHVVWNSAFQFSENDTDFFMGSVFSR